MPRISRLHGVHGQTPNGVDGGLHDRRSIGVAHGGHCRGIRRFINTPRITGILPVCAFVPTPRPVSRPNVTVHLSPTQTVVFPNSRNPSLAVSRIKEIR